MKRIIEFTATLLIFIPLLNCSTNETINLKSDLDELIGSWTWIGSKELDSTIEINPANSGNSMSIEFFGDNTFKKFINGEEVYYSPFILVDNNSAIKIQFTTLALFESQGSGFDHKPTQEVRFLKNSNLQLVDNSCCENVIFEFVR